MTGFADFDRLLAGVREHKVKSWSEVEPEFLEGVEHFDAEYATGSRDSGWYQMKARYFNDLVVQLIGNTCGRELSVRCKKNSQLFSKIDIDICFPAEGDPVVAGEVKVLGTPPHPKNAMKARGGSSDLHKRAREVAFTSMDIKAAYSPIRKISSFQEWIDSSTPAYSSFWAIRANDTNDLDRTRSTLTSLRSYCNGVGAIIYLPSPQSPVLYEVKRFPELSVDRAIRDFAQRIISCSM